MRFAVARATLAVLLLAGGALASLAIAADSVSRSRRAERWLRAGPIARFEASRATFEDMGIYESFEERVFHETIPSLREGEPLLALFGGSNAKQTLLPEELPEDLRGRFELLAVGGCTGSMLERLVLTVDRGKHALRPGSTVIFGLWWGFLSEKPSLEEHFLRYPAERWGLWKWGPEAFEPAGSLRDTRFELVRLRALRRALKDRALAGEEPLPSEPGPPRPEDLRYRIDRLVDFYGPLRVPGASTVALERTLALVRDRGARVAVVELPAPSWLRERPERALWQSWIVPACRRIGVPRYDLEGFLRDEDFHGDYTLHARLDGRRRLQGRLVEIVRELER